MPLVSRPGRRSGALPCPPPPPTPRPRGQHRFPLPMLPPVVLSRPGNAFSTRMLVDHHSLVVRSLALGSRPSARLWVVHAAGAGPKANSNWVAVALTFRFSMPGDRFKVRCELSGIFSTFVSCHDVAAALLRHGRTLFGGTPLLIVPTRLLAVQWAFFLPPVDPPLVGPQVGPVEVSSREISPISAVCVACL
jgi:hypothetical protein